MEAVLFFLAAIGCVAGAIGVVAARNPFYSVLALIGHLFSLAVLFLLLTSAFVAAAQVVVYAGAVMVLYVFVVAYVGGGGESAWEPIPGQRFLAPLLALALFVELSVAVLSSALLALGSHGPDVPAGFGDPAAIGRLLLEKFLVPFEASSILLLIAAVGAIVLAGRRGTGGMTKGLPRGSSEHSSEAPAERSEDPPAAPLLAPFGPRRPARTTAPTAARSRRIDEASKGRRNRSSRSLPIPAGSPKPGCTSVPWVPRAVRDEPRTAIESSMKRAAPRSGARKRWPGIGSQADSVAPPT
jgi:NADH-quinone oxidoreductase subunit J